jgi:hypothetical protein
MLYPAEQFCSQELTYSYKCFSGTQWVRITWSKESNRLGAPCLKTEAETASETLCFSLYVLHDEQSPQEEKCICMLYAIVKTS